MNPASTSLRTGLFGRPVSTIARAAVLCSALLLAGCLSGRNDDYTLEPARPADVIYAEATAAVDEGHLRDAIELFQELDRSYPYSEPARQGLVVTTFAYYQLGDYEEAITTADRFLLLFPNHPDAATVLHYKGEAYLRQVPDVTRDQEAARQALAVNQELLDRFPTSEYAALARLNIIAVEDQLAGQDMLVGRYYLERRDYVAAVNRFHLVVTDYGTTRHVEEALFRLTEAYLAMGLVAEAQTAAAVLGQNFPDGTWYQQAYDLLGTVGVTPVAARPRLFGN